MLINETLQETAINSRLALGLAGACVGLSLLATGSAAAADQKQWTLESTTDVTSHGSLYVDASATMSPFGGLYDSGFRIRLTSSFNRYSLTEPQRNASNRSIDVLMGYTHMFEKASVSMGAGPTIANVQETGDTALNATQVGGKIFLSSYARPTATTMLYGQLSYSSATQFRLAQTKLGWQIMPRVYAGPEVSVTGGRGFTQARIGAHVTGFSAGMISSGLTVGYVQDSNRGSGYFSSLTLQADM